MSNIQKTEPSPEALSALLLTGDLSRLSAEEKLKYYDALCDSLGLNPLTKPFAFIKFQGKEVLYATRDCADQLRKIHSISIRITAREKIDGVYVVTASASTPSGRCDESTGAVVTDGLRGDNLANSFLKCETKAKRRVTLSICGLGLLDETEVETIKDAQKVDLPRPHEQAQTVRVPIKTLADIKEEHSKEIQQAIKSDMERTSKPVDKPISIKEAFIVPDGMNLGLQSSGEYIIQIGKVGGNILHRKIKDVGEKQLRVVLADLRKMPLDKQDNQYIQEFIYYSEDWINEQNRKD